MSDVIEPIFQIGGALLGNSTIYVKRVAEEEAIQQIRRKAYLKLIEPRQQGKTSLINWLSGKLRAAGYSFAVADVSSLDKSNELAWYNDLCKRILGQVDFISDGDHIQLLTTSRTWRHFLADLARCADKIGQHVVIALDEIGTTHQAWAESFFRTLRDVFNNRQNEPYFEHLAFILAGCYNPAALIRDENESPFNVAVRIRLPDFTYEQARCLATHLQLSEEQMELIARRIHYWTDGQPYLTQLLCHYLTSQHQSLRQIDVDQAVQRIYREDQNHLLPMLSSLARKPRLQEDVKRILNGYKTQFSISNSHHLQLELIGVIKADAQGYCVIRNPVYAHALDSGTDHESPVVKVPSLAKSIEVFISYAHADEALCKELTKHLIDLKRRGLITNWYDREIPAGTVWAREIDEHLNTAQIILLLVSSDFLYSDYCHDIEMKRAMERYERGEVQVIPIILRPVSWEGALFGKLQALPRDGKPVTTWPNKDEAFLNVTEGIQKIIVNL